MSADNQIIVLAYRTAHPEAAWKYAAMKIGHPSDLQCQDYAFDYAKELAGRKEWFWFDGPGASGRARKMARLLTEEHVANGWILEYENILFVECSEVDGGVWYLPIPRRD